MGLFRRLFGDAADNNDNIRKSDESFDDFTKRISERRLKPDDVTLENLSELNRETALESGLITQDEYLSARRKEHFERYYKELDQINTRKQQAQAAEPISDWYMGGDGYMVRSYSDGSVRRD
jgi:hypothetical protein